jgi:uncharacterized membrane protein YeaQ/YmgE (transglycosylase-associated protein family)
MNLIIFLIVGGLIGWIASKIMGTDAQQGLLLNIVVGIVGAFLGGLIFGWITGEPGIGLDDPLDIGKILVSIAGACVLLFLWKMISGRKRVV